MPDATTAKSLARLPDAWHRYNATGQTHVDPHLLLPAAMEMMFIARRFIINLNLAYERSGIGACRRAFPDDEKDLIRNAYEKRIQDTQGESRVRFLSCCLAESRLATTDETEELRKTSDANFSEHCLPEDASKFLTDYTTFYWNSPVTTEEGDPPLQSTTPNEPLPSSVSTLVRPSESTASDSRWQPSNAEPSTSTRNSVVGRGRSSKGRKVSISFGALAMDRNIDTDLLPARYFPGPRSIRA